MYPFNESGQEIRLHTGRLTVASACDAAGVVLMSCGSKFVARWKVDGYVPASWATRLVGADPVTFGLSRPGGDVEVTGRLRTFHDGKLNGSTLVELAVNQIRRQRNISSMSFAAADRPSRPQPANEPDGDQGDISR